MRNSRNLLHEVQDALAKEPSFRNCLPNIYVLVNESAVILAGAVDTIQLKKLAKKTVSAIPGILLIEDLKVDSAQHDGLGVQIDWATSKTVIV